MWQLFLPSNTLETAIIPDISITSIGTVESVKIFSKIPIQNIRSAALDKSSLTSCALTRIILKEQYRISPQYSQWNMQYDITGTDTDAVLIIGDNALKIFDNGYVTLDLGQSWYEFTGLPFVYALWVVKRNRHIPGINNLLKSAKEAGIRSVKALAITESQRLQLAPERCLNYLAHSIRYDFGEAEIKGLLTFYQHALSLGLAPKGGELVFN